MKKGIVWGIIIIGVAVIGIVVYSYQQASESETEVINKQSGPHIVVDPTTYDFGRVKFGDVPEHTFIVKNTGDRNLKIESVSTSCACTKGEMKVNNIAPGEQAELMVNFDPAVHGDDSDMGELTRTVYIVSNDSNQEEIEIKIYADVYK